jgi:AhpD family alkylhydroperoxidase
MSRIKFHKAFPEGMQAMVEMSKIVHESGLEDSLLQLVFTRASQVNGCAFCLNMHTVDALKAGERDVRLYLLNAWREAGIYTEREQAALALTEAMTLLGETKHVSDEVWEAAAEEFEERELAALMLAIAQINSWNRLQIATEAPPHLE